MTENTSSIVLTQSSIDHQNLFIVFFMPSKRLQITFIVSGLVQLQLVKSRLLATTDPTELPTLFFFNNNTLNAHHSYIATGMRVIVEYNNVQDKWGLSNIHSTHTTVAMYGFIHDPDDSMELSRVRGSLGLLFL